MFARLSLIAALLASTAAFAAPIDWTDWTAASGGGAQGTIAGAGGPVGVSYSGGYSFVQTGCGTAYWVPGSYNGAFNQPFACDIVALDSGGQKTISFDTAVTDLFVAVQSWNGNRVRFDQAFDVASNGSGFWGSGTPVVDGDSMGFTGIGEVHAILHFSGTFSSLSFTDTSENWHGFTVGLQGVPEPTTLALLAPGFALALLLGARRRRQQQRAA